MSPFDTYLVESYCEQGEPRQRTVAYLGNVRQIGQDFPAINGLFLLRTWAILTSIEELTAADANRLWSRFRSASHRWTATK
ncbi:MAG: hypothetical protein R2856_28310 [Caldilineaceae bacterium]